MKAPALLRENCAVYYYQGQRLCAVPENVKHGSDCKFTQFRSEEYFTSTYSLSIGARCFVVKPFVVLLARPKVVVK